MLKTISKTYIYILTVCLGYFTAPICAEEPQLLPFGFMEYTFSDVSIEDTKVAIDHYLQKLFHHTGNKPLAVTFSQLNTLKQALTKHEIDLVSLSSIDFLRLQPDSLLTPFLARVQTNDKLYDTYVLLTHKNKQWKSLTDLENTSLHVLKSDDLGIFWLDVELAKAQRPKANVYFNKITQDNRNPQSILAVFFGKSDACLVNSTTFEAMSKLNPQIGQQLVPLLTSPPFISGFLCTHSNMPLQRRNALRNASLNLPQNSDGQQVIRLFNTKQVIPFEPEYLKTVQDLFTQYQTYYGTTSP